MGQPVTLADEAVLRLNIGGTEFSVSKDLVMSEEWMLSAMFSGRYPVQPQSDGAYHIGKSGLGKLLLIGYQIGIPLTSLIYSIT